MTDAEILTLLKTDLQISATAYDDLLASMITSAKSFIATEGITLNAGDVADCNLVRMYAAYLYRNRADDKFGMPRMLRYALNNRLLHEKGGAN